MDQIFLNLCLLDRNLVIEIEAMKIREHSATKENLSRSSQKKLERLRALDSDKNRISAIFSVIEGEIGSSQSREEMIACLKKETGWLSGFFRKALIDNYFLDDDRESLFVDTYKKLTHRDEEKYLPFIRYVFPLLKNEVQPHETMAFAKEIFEGANKYKIARSHPIVIVALSCLYGDIDARKVLKPNVYSTEEIAQKKAYNVFHDIFKLMEVAYIRALWSIDGASGKVKFITDDKHLERLGDKLMIKVSETVNEGVNVVSYRTEWSPDHWPKLDHDSRERIYLAQQININSLDPSTLF